MESWSRSGRRVRPSLTLHQRAAHETRGLSTLCKKTALCQFHTVGKCKRGKLCNFAHSSEELRSVPDLSLTRLCPTLLQFGWCSVTNCTYAHAKQELQQATWASPRATLHEPADGVTAVGASWASPPGNENAPPDSWAACGYEDGLLLDGSHSFTWSRQCSDGSTESQAEWPMQFQMWQQILQEREEKLQQLQQQSQLKQTQQLHDTENPCSSSPLSGHPSAQSQKKPLERRVVPPESIPGQSCWGAWMFLCEEQPARFMRKNTFFELDTAEKHELRTGRASSAPPLKTLWRNCGGTAINEALGNTRV